MAQNIDDKYRAAYAAYLAAHADSRAQYAQYIDAAIAAGEPIDMIEYDEIMYGDNS